MSNKKSFDQRKPDDWTPKNKIGIKGRKLEDLVFKNIDLNDR